MGRKQKRRRGKKRENDLPDISLEVINDEKVTRIPIEIDERPVKGHRIYSELYYNSYYVAPTWSGKTTALFKHLKSVTGKKTTIIVFCASLFNDDNWIYIRNYFEEKGIGFEGHTGIVEDGVNVLDELVKELQEQAHEREEKIHEKEKDKEDDEVVKEDVHQWFLNRQNAVPIPDKKEKEKKDKPKQKRGRYQIPDYVIVFDDVADQIRTPSYNTLLKYSRHFHIQTVTSSQDLKDICPASRLQIRVWAIFRGLTPSRLEDVYECLNLRRVSWELFKKLYDLATEPTEEEPRPFLYIAPRSLEFRRNFNTRLIVKGLEA